MKEKKNTLIISSRKIILDSIIFYIKGSLARLPFLTSQNSYIL